jgi:hypothetical protein
VSTPSEGTFVSCPHCGADNKVKPTVRAWYNRHHRTGAWYRWTKCEACRTMCRAHYNTYLHRFIEPDYSFTEACTS